MQEILIKGGFKALVDDEDYKYLNCHNWYPVFNTSGNCYAQCVVDGKFMLMHRFILKPKIGEIIDHKDGDGLNNTRSNLRVCDRKQNRYNSAKRKDSKFKYKGVCFNATIKYFGKNRRKVVINKDFPYAAKLRKNGKTYYLGVYKTQEEAGRAYDVGARVHHGEFARLNFPDGLTV